MKQVILSFLLSSICINAFTQLDTSKKINPYSGKWEITKSNAKTATGKLFMSLPKGTAWDITIYAAGTNKVISNTMLKTAFTLLPGYYDLEINHIWIKGVPIEKGNNTRLKAGVLEITTTGAWTLYDETKETVLINTYAPQKRGLPVGKYVLTIMGQDEAVEIKDQNPANVTEVTEGDNWVTTPLPAMAAGMGKLSINIPKDTTVYVPTLGKSIKIPLSIMDTVKSYKDSYNYKILALPNYLATGTYSLSLNHVKFSVPVKQGKETRIKAGFLLITKKQTDGDNPEGTAEHLYGEVFGDPNDNDETWEWTLQIGTFTKYTGKKGAMIALPPGEYTLVKKRLSDNKKVTYKVKIKDGVWVKNGIKVQ